MRVGLLFFLFSFFFSYGQQMKIDSLKNRIELEKGQLKLALIDSLNELILYNGDQNKEELKYLNLMLKQAKKIKNSKLEAKAARFISIQYQKREDYKNAEKFAVQSKILSKKHHNYRKLIKAYNQLGRMYNHFDDYKKSIHSFKKGIIIFEEQLDSTTNNLKTLSVIYANLGKTYFNIKYDSLAYTYYYKSAQLADLTNDYERKSNFNAEIAWTYYVMNQYKQAEKYFQLGLKDSSKVKLKVYNYAIIQGLGVNYLDWGQYKKALKYNKLALTFFKKQNNRLYTNAVLNNITKVYLAQKDIKNSIKFASKTLETALQINNTKALIDAKITMSRALILNNKTQNAEKELLLILNTPNFITKTTVKQHSQIFKTLSELQKKNKNYKMALHYNDLFILYKDSMINRKLANIPKIEMRYKIGKKEKEIKNQKQNLSAKTKQQNLLLLVLSLSILLLLVLTYLFRKIKLKNQIIINLQNEIHHRIKNNLGMVNRFINVSMKKVSDKKTLDNYTNLNNRIASIKNIHKLLYDENRIIGTVDLQKMAEKIATLTFRVYKTKKQISIKINAPIKIESKKAQPIGLIINELIMNAYKYAFVNQETGIINLNACIKADNILLSISDNGSGFPKDFDLNKTKSYGLKLVYGLVQQLNGNIIFNEVKPGSKITIEIPKK